MEIDTNGNHYFHSPPSVEEMIGNGFFNGAEFIFPINGIPNAGRLIPVFTSNP